MKGIARIGGMLAGAITLVAIVVPFAVPPVATRFAEAKLAALGHPAVVRLDLAYRWRGGPELAGSLDLSLTGSPWTVHADFGAGFGTYRARVRMPKTNFSESEPTIRKLLVDHPVSTISNLAFSGAIALEASVERTRAFPVPVWSAKIPLELTAANLMSGETPIAVTGLAVTPAARGIAGHVDIDPAFLRMTSLAVGDFVFEHPFAAIHATDEALLVTEASAGFCAGTVGLYSLFLNPASLDAGFTLFLDEVEAGQILSHVNGFSGEASGRLHGKVGLFCRGGGKTIRLRNAFLYSTPGETGKLKMAAPETFTDNLALAGIDDGARANVSDALTDMDYSVLRLDLRHGDERSATLGVRIDGSATRGARTVPVNLNINLNGRLEQILNMGLGYSSKLKGK